MKVIGAGFGRTGTLSLKLALDQLGFGPTIHASVFRDLNNVALDMAWHLKIHGHKIPWEKLVLDYQSAVDWPVSFFWKEMAEHYLDAKIILTVRPAREWLASMKKTILPRIQMAAQDERHNGKAIVVLLYHHIFKGDLSDENLMRCYAKNTVDVRSFDPARVLEFNVRDGWAPLCRFLKVPVPDEPFPQTNDAAFFEEDIARAQRVAQNSAQEGAPA